MTIPTTFTNVVALLTMALGALAWSQVNSLGGVHQAAPAVLAAALLAGFELARRLQPIAISEGDNARSARAINAASQLALLVMQASLLIAAHAPTGSAVNLGMGVMLLVIGNYMPLIRRNRTFGIRTPWTQKDDRVWDLTHRYLGWTMVACGISLFFLGTFIEGEATQRRFSIATPVILGAALLLTLRIKPGTVTPDKKANVS